MTIFPLTLVIISLLAGIIWQLMEAGMLFTTVRTGTMKFVVAGESWTKTIANIPDKSLNDKGVLVDGEKRKKVLEKTFGLFFVGLPFIRKVYSFPIIKEKENPRAKADDPKTWIDRQDRPEMVDELRWKFPRPILVPDVEFSEALKATILVLCKFEVLAPVVPVFIQHARFFELLAAYVRNGVINYCQKMSLNDFIKADKKDGGDMSTKIIADINSFVEKEIGIRLTGLGVTNYEAEEDETSKALAASEKARLLAEAAAQRAEGEAKADNIRAKARVADIVETVADLINKGVSPDVAAQVAHGVGRAERFTRSDSKITTLVDGGGSNVAVPLPQGDRK